MSMLSFLNALVVRPETELTRKHKSDSVEYVSWRHQAFNDASSIVMLESTLLGGLIVFLIWLAVRLAPVVGSKAARAGGSGTLGLIMALVVLGAILAGFRLYQDIVMIRRLNAETFDLEERLGDDEP